MKKLLAILLCLVMVLSMAACGGSDEGKTDDTAADTTAAESKEAQTNPDVDTTEMHELYLIEDRNNLQGLISPVNLVDRSGIEKALPTEQKSDLTLGCDLGTLMSSFFVDIQNGFEDKCKEYGYEYNVLVSDNDTSAMFSIVDTFIAQGVDGIMLHGDADAITTAAQTAVEAGIPCDGCSVPNDLMNPMITAVTNGDFNGGYVTGLYVGENLYYPTWKDQADPVKATAMFGTAGNQISNSKLCGILTGMIESVTACKGEPIEFEDAAVLANSYITQLTLDGQLLVPEINMDVVAFGEGAWLTADALAASEDLFTLCPDMQLMFCDNDYMAIGGILAAQAIGVNLNEDCYIFACSDGTMVALEYIRDNLLYATGVNCAYALGWGNVEMFHKIYEEGFDASNMPNQTLVDTIALTAENWEENYDPSIELVRDAVGIDFLTTEEKLAEYGM